MTAQGPKRSARRLGCAGRPLRRRLLRHCLRARGAALCGGGWRCAPGVSEELLGSLLGRLVPFHCEALRRLRDHCGEDLRRAVIAGGRNSAAVRCEGGHANRAGVALEGCLALCAGHVPKLGCLVVGGGEQFGTVRRKTSRPHGQPVPREGGLPGARLHVQRLRDLAARGGHGLLPIRQERQAPHDRPRVAFEGPPALAGLDVEELDRPTVAARQQLHPVRRERRGIDAARVALEGLLTHTGGKVKEPGGPVHRGREGLLGVWREAGRQDAPLVPRKCADARASLGVPELGSAVGGGRQQSARSVEAHQEHRAIYQLQA
mmetsp:Transcript_43556/g.130112  ORF Transcript_43556/g.130112 Transcript_43556/m.130112 type:complete len:319 (+) Transcript_43556:323-1279(+)